MAAQAEVLLDAVDDSSPAGVNAEVLNAELEVWHLQGWDK